MSENSHALVCRRTTSTHGPRPMPSFLRTQTKIMLSVVVRTGREVSQGKDNRGTEHEKTSRIPTHLPCTPYIHVHTKHSPGVISSHVGFYFLSIMPSTCCWAMSLLPPLMIQRGIYSPVTNSQFRQNSRSSLSYVRLYQTLPKPIRTTQVRPRRLVVALNTHRAWEVSSSPMSNPLSAGPSSRKGP